MRQAEHLNVRSSLAKPAVQVKAHRRDITRLEAQGDILLSGDEEGRLTLLMFEKKRQGHRESVTLKQRWSKQSESFKPVMSIAVDRQKGIALIGGGPTAQLSILSLDSGSVIHRLSLEEK